MNKERAEKRDIKNDKEKGEIFNMAGKEKNYFSGNFGSFFYFFFRKEMIFSPN